MDTPVDRPGWKRRSPSRRVKFTFAVDIPALEPLPATGRAAGVDLGITDFAVTSDGQRIANPRHLERRARNLVRDHDVIVLEDLAVTNMVRNRMLAKAILDCGWGTFRAMLEYKAAGLAVAGGDPGHACGADVRHPGSSRCSRL